VVGLSLLGVETSRALAFGVLYHVTQIVPLVLIGGLYALGGKVGRVRLNELAEVVEEVSGGKD
jgi:hypothetical protein